MQARTSSQRRILWVSSLILDVSLHKTSTIEILRALVKRGHKVVLFASHSSNNKWRKEIADIEVISFPLRYVPIFSTVAYIFILLLYLPIYFVFWKPDYVIIPSRPTVLSLMPILVVPKSKRPKIVLYIMSTPVSLFGFRGDLKQLFFSISLQIAKKYFQGISILTELMREEVRIRYNISTDFFDIWTSGVSTATFKTENFDRDEMRKRFSLEDKFIIFYHGSISKLRGIIETIKALKILKKMYPDLYLFLLGNSNFPVKELVNELDVKNMVKMHNSVSHIEVPKFIAMCDVGIVPLPNLPDWRYQLPLKLLEYLAMEKVVIATDIPANREVIGKSKCGIFTPSTNPEEIANTIVFAYNNRNKLKKWGLDGRKIIEEKYSWEKIAENCENYLFNL